MVRKKNIIRGLQVSVAELLSRALQGENESLAELARQALHGSGRAQRALYKVFETRIGPVLRAMCGDPEDAKDLLHELCGKVTLQKELSRVPDPVRYLYRSAINEAISLFRKRTRRSEIRNEKKVDIVQELHNGIEVEFTSQVEFCTSGARSPESIAITAENKEHIERVLAIIPKKLQHCYNGLKAMNIRFRTDLGASSTEDMR